MNHRLTIWIKNHICKHFYCHYIEQPRPDSELARCYYDFGIRVYKCRRCGHTYSMNINDNYVFKRGFSKVKVPPGTAVNFRRYELNIEEMNKNENEC